MAMAYTLTSALQEALSRLLLAKAELRNKEDDARAQAEEEAELARTRGTPVTPAAFAQWKAGFLLEIKAKREKDQADYLRSLTAKEREERKRIEMRPTGLSDCRREGANLTVHRSRTVREGQGRPQGGRGRRSGGDSRLLAVRAGAETGGRGREPRGAQRFRLATLENYHCKAMSVLRAWAETGSAGASDFFRPCLVRMCVIGRPVSSSRIKVASSTADAESAS
jgi:hypothetical protein